MYNGLPMKYTFLKQIALYSGFNGNDLRLILLLSDQKMRLKEIVNTLRWDKGNTSRALKKLVECGAVRKTETDNGVFFKTDADWKSPEVPGQIKIEL